MCFGCEAIKGSHRVLEALFFSCLRCLYRNGTKTKSRPRGYTFVDIVYILLLYQDIYYIHLKYELLINFIRPFLDVYHEKEERHEKLYA